MRILVTGSYDGKYNRTLIILEGFRKLGIQVIEYPLPKNWRGSRRTLLAGYKIRKLSRGVDFVFLPSFSHKYVPFVKKYCQAPLVFDPLISKYQSKTEDYQTIKAMSFKGKKLLKMENSAFTCADFIIADTKQHKDLFSELHNIEREKIGIAEVGADCNLFYPLEKKNKQFSIGFYGGFIPLQGTLNIIEAVGVLNRDDIRIELVGTGFQYEIAKNKIEEQQLNIDLPGWIEYSNLNKRINSYDICLGIFGTGSKSNNVIANKIFHYAACGKAIITKDSPAIREVFTHGENIWLCDNSANSIAEAILYLQEQTELRAQLGKAARALICNHYNPGSISTKIINGFNDCVKTPGP